MTFKRRHAPAQELTPVIEKSDVSEQSLREFVYLDESSVQSLLVSLVGALPAEITSLSARSSEAEATGTIGIAPPLLAKAELTARFQGSSSNSNQVLSRAVAESLFKNFYELIRNRLAWSSKADQGSPAALERGSLIEVEVELTPDPIYGFSATIGVLTDLADDYPGFVQNPTTALVVSEAGPINRVLERLLVGLIPIKSPAIDLRAAELNGKLVAGGAAYFKTNDLASEPLFVVGVTEQDKYWRDVRRVLFSKSNFTILGRIGRSGVQRTWTPVKLTEVMREVAPQFSEAISRVGSSNYSSPLNSREEANRDALEGALVSFALAAGGEAAVAKVEEIQPFAKGLRELASGMKDQTRAFDKMTAWLVESGVLHEAPANTRALRIAARSESGLRTSAEARSLSDLVPTSSPPDPVPEMLLDLEVIAIYW